nr:reverse transcriptase domain-containing protein [Tanacetum cinerariifolium]
MTFVSAGTIPPISIDDYEVAHADGQEGASVDGETTTVDNINPFSDVSIAELNILDNPSSNLTPSTNSNPKGRNRRRSKQKIKESNLDELSPPTVTMANQRIMAQLLQAPTEGFEDAIVVPTITANNFELKHGLPTLVQNNQFFGHDKEDPHAHIRYFNKITSTLKFPNVPNTSIMLMLFPFSLEGATRIWLEKEPPRSIFTWVDLVSKFINQFFPPTKTTNLRNEITNFQQRFDESFSAAWDRFKDLLRACILEEDFLAYVKANDAVMRNMQTQGQNMQNQLTNLTDLLTKFMNSNSASTLSSGTLSSNIIANQRSDLKAITTRSGVSYDGPQIPSPHSFLPKVVENKPEATKDMVTSTNNERIRDAQPLVVQTKTPEIQISKPVSEPVIASVSAPKPNSKSSIPYPSRRNNERNREKANNHIQKFYQIFKYISFKISFADSLILIPKFASTLKALIENKEKLSEIARTLLNEHCSAVLLKKLLEKLGDPSKFLIPCDFLRMDECLALADLVLASILCHFDAFLALEDDPTSLEVDQTYLDPEGDILLLEAFLNDDPSLPHSNQGNYLPEVRKELKICEAKSNKSLIDEPPEVEIKDLPPHLEYAFLEGDDKLSVIIAKDLSTEEKTALITVLKLLDARLIYQISNSPWVSPVHCVPKRGGFTVVENEENELIPIRLVTGWRVCIDYRKLNEATRKDHFPLTFMDQMLERLAGNQYYCFLDGFSGYFQIPINLKDQEKTTFTCPYGTFAYRRMPFGQCNAPGTFQMCMIPIFHKMIEKNMEVFMDDFSVFGNSFQSCLSYLEKMLKRCEDTNLYLNWEQSHFMVKEGIVLGHKISKERIEVDKAKVDVITKLPHPTTVKVLGQHQEKHFRPIHYASKTMTEAESNYTTTEKEMLAVVYAFEKFQSYLIMNKSILYTDHSALKYLFAKKDSKARLLR